MNYNDKLLYLKALCKTKGDKKVAKEIANGIKYLNKKTGLGYTYRADKKPLNPKEDQIQGKKFILKFCQEFLDYAVDYSMIDRVEDLLHPQE